MIWLFRRIVLAVLLAVSSAASVSGGAQAQDLPDDFYIPWAPESRASNVQPWKPAPPQWRKMLDYYIDNDILPGVSVLIKSPKWGVRFVSAGQPIVGRDDFAFSPSTHFRIGSCSKATVTLVMLQMDYEHKLNLADPITMHLPPEITSQIPHAEDITIRNCLDMTSGLRSYTDINLFGDPQPETALMRFDPDYILSMAMEDNSPVFIPETTTDGEIHNYDYSNTGYLICGLIAERIDKKPLEDILRDRVFHKIGMTDTFLATDHRITRRTSHGYTAFYETGAWQDCIVYDMTVPWSAGAVISTSFDLLHFYETIFESEKLIPAVARRKFLRMNYAHEHKGYGKAVLEEVLPTGAVLGHGGTVLGFLTLMLYAPEADFYYINYMNTWDNKYVRSEVFTRIAHLAFGAPECPFPSDGTTVRLNGGKATLTWRPGYVSGDEYHVYISTLSSAVTNATIDNHSGVMLERVSSLELVKSGLDSGKRYYWRVDTHRKRSEREILDEHEDIEVLMENFNTYHYREVSDYETIPGPVWTFIAE